MTIASRHAAQLFDCARRVDRLVLELQGAPWAAPNAAATLAEVSQLLIQLEGRSEAPMAAVRGSLSRLADVLREARPAPAGAVSINRGGRVTKLLRRIALALAAATALVAPTAAAAQSTTPTPPPAVAYSVTNPVTGGQEQVLAEFNANAVLTQDGNVIFLRRTVGETFTEVRNGQTLTFEVVGVDPNAAGRPYRVSIQQVVPSGQTRPAAEQRFLVTDRSGQVAGATPGPQGTDGSGTSANPVSAVFVRSQKGVNGGNGSNGGGVEICAFGGCITLGKDPTDGGKGEDGPTVTETAQISDGPIVTSADYLSGVIISSVGGDGGSGGSSIGIALPGADGGAAGAGGEVSATNHAQVTTSGKAAHAVFVQSRSGKGGAGGAGYGAAPGGDGGAAAPGGHVTAYNDGTLTTTGDEAVGFLVQSLGGGAGGGGDSYGVVGAAGNGSLGGAGGQVDATNGGTIRTSGASAYGVLAQSIGGSGGRTGSAGGIVALGEATGGGGGAGGDVTLTATGRSDIQTTGAGSHGLFAQSVGGGGGVGGVSAGLAGLGAKGGAASNGGDVTVDNAGVVKTTGAFSNAIMAQSIGGGGGDGGIGAGVFVAVGGQGSAGGNAGKVTVTHSGELRTEGADSHGIMAQAVGGGGGNGGAAGSVSAFFGVAVGGAAGGGGDGGEVDVNLTPQTISVGGVNQAVDPLIVTRSDRSHGIFAQSVGGGGGSGGLAAQITAGYSAAVSIAVGGEGGNGGDGGLVTADGSAAIATKGAFSNGMLVQSVGGGGGAGGFSVSVALAAGETAAGSLAVSLGGKGGLGGDGGEVRVDAGGSILTEGDFSTGFMTQSVGGGGGAGGFSVAASVAGAGVASGALSVGLGGQGGGGGEGGKVTSTFDGAITTLGDDSVGAIIQSVGGGGGAGGFNVAGAISGSGTASASGAVGVGGSGGDGGDGDVVIGAVEGPVATGGDRSGGVLIQSVGGGGGSGGFNVSGTIGGAGTVGVGISVGVGGAGGLGGDGKSATGRAGGSIRTDGDQSTAFLTQSVGGGGGSGGFNVSGSIGGGGTVGGGLSVGVGGAGGGGGDAGEAHGTVVGSVLTTGDGSDGVVVQSMGGGGGSGAFNVAGAIGGAGTVGAGLSVGVGGMAGDGGHADSVTARAEGAIRTEGDKSNAFLAQAVGGGGGAGGFTVSGAIGGGGTVGGGLAVGVGGMGGLGGDAGDVDDSVSGVVVGAIETLGDGSNGMTVQSLGGGGGAGGFSVAGSIGGGGNVGAGISVGVGGMGGGGGHGRAASGRAESSIHTSGDQAVAMTVQSVGGGGGSGGFNVSGAIGGAGTVGAGLSVGVGGFGGDGGDAGAANGSVLGFVLTEGEASHGVVVQSLGGGGGNGGFSVSGAIGGAGTVGGALTVGVGGFGGDGGTSGDVTAAASGVETLGVGARGFLAQSVGGGGGNGGFNVSGSIGGGGTAGGGVAVGVGGFAGGGGDAGDVTATLTNGVVTRAAGAEAVLAQSLGGGGGNGGFNVSGSIGGAGKAAVGMSVGIGGFAGDGGDAGEVNLTLSGGAFTEGLGSHAVTAQSIGGGGGNGGFNVSGAIGAAGTGAGTLGVSVGGFGGGGGDGEAVTVDITGATLADGRVLAIQTLGGEAHGLLAQSLGGGGGAGGFSVTGGISGAKTGAGNIGVGVGGGGGDGGDGRDVSASVTGDIVTQGADSVAALVQSVGGGGGAGGFNVSGGVAGAKTGSGNLMVGVGGFGGGGGDAGSASGAITGDVWTDGDRSSGVSYQSIGGGGGSGGFNITGGVSLSGSGGGSGTLGVGVGGFGGDGGDASFVDASLTGDVRTHGQDAFGVLLQSAGGGGGSGGMNVTGGLSISAGMSGVIGVGVGGFGGGGGDASYVNGVLTGDVFTQGNGAYGALLQSLAGGGGAGGLNVTGGVALSLKDNAAGALSMGLGGFGGAGGDAGAVTGVVTGRYQTEGRDAVGVSAQSIGGGGGVGGLNVSGAVSFSKKTNGSASIGLGGFGGDGGDGSTVDLTRVGDTYTDGANAHAVVAQSIGGGGGSGGINVSGGVSATLDGSAASLGMGLGGFGGGGGDASDVTASVTGNVWALGMGQDHVVADDDGNLVRLREEGSHGVLAQSIGGNGGAGGINVTGQLAITKPGGSSATRSLALGVGGFGGDGGQAGAVDLTIKAPGADRVQVAATGDRMMAAAAQSIGGGGGAGGINVSGGISSRGQITAGVGGFGGAGGTGADVHADVDADLFTSGRDSFGFVAQSIGGGGGVGGINVSGGVSYDKNSEESSLVFGVGGFGGAGNISGDVTATQRGDILAEGVNTRAIVVQSIAGGGGVGGLNVSALGSATGSTNDAKGYGLAVGVGGNGGTGADAGDVSLTSVGDIVVNGKLRAQADANGDWLEAADGGTGGSGVLVQSIGGGGGAGGVNAAASITPRGNPVVIGVGGSGASGGDAGTVTVRRGVEADGTEPGGLIRTFGDDANGLVAQSIGGGGGVAGMNFTVALTLGTTAGGPDDNPNAVNIGVGGSGAGAGSGDTVDVLHRGVIRTAGVNSNGLIAQSIGGGGGSGSFNIGLGVLKNANAANVAIGGATGAGGSGGDVTVDHDGAIITAQKNSVAILAQSIGGGGGNTGTDMVMGPLNRNELAITIGRHGGVGGEGGDVTVTKGGLIDTSGESSHGVLAQSIGGGGGASSATTVGLTGTRGQGDAAKSYSASVNIGLDGGVGAISGDVRVTQDGDLITRGDKAAGVFAQSIGGGGGAGGAASATVVRATGAATLTVGGNGGVGAASGEVEVANLGRILTEGDDADGVRAQSIGGGGGYGGMTRTIEVQVGGAPEDATQRTASINVGGTGGAGAIGDRVEVRNEGVIATQGDDSYGVRAQSIGGGGGQGGAVIHALVQGPNRNQSASVNIGGSGGDGGAGGEVTVANHGVVFTEGARAVGVAANSIGGGGGGGGLILDAALGYAGAEKQAQRFTLAIGGSGGVGGAGGTVSVVNRPTSAADTGLIVTRGEEAHGVFAQSLGGGGGNGSSIVSLNAMVASRDSVLAGLQVGGAGGSGNTGGDVSVDNAGVIDTTGRGAYGVLAQSIGGGGGNGGMAIAASVVLAKAYQNTPLLVLGGVGGDGGDGGDVHVVNSGQIVTRGADAHGLVAQSIGGGGGSANFGFAGTGEAASFFLSNALSALVGTSGGGIGGLGGDVTVEHTGDITVLGDGSQAIKAQSINGGGGAIRLDVSGITGVTGVALPAGILTPDPTATADPLVAAKLGAQDAHSMNAGKVSVTSTGTFGAAGDDTVGDLTQAIGGGGGEADVNLAAMGNPADMNGLTMKAVRVDLALGGSNGVDNNAGDIVSRHSGRIVTEGANAPGVMAQSLGGGGGRINANLASQAGGIGAISVTLGGVNGQNEAGGDVTRTQDGLVATLGDLSPAMLLQSIGGGGGSVAVSLTGATGAAVAGPGVSTQAVSIQQVSAADLSAQAVPAQAQIALGAAGGQGLDGGDVTATLSGGLLTVGDHAPALVVQSIGAGGGEVRLAGIGQAAVTLGASGGAKGDGGDINLVNTGAVSTAGTGSHGLFLQSIGGGGGAVFGAGSATVATRSANVGDGGDLTLRQTADVSVDGANAIGVAAQTLGGGGGWVDGVFAGSAGGAGAGGAIDLTLQGAVLATNSGGRAVYAQSEGRDGAGDIRVDLSGAVRGGSGSGVGVDLVGGDANLVRTTGSLSAVSGLAVRATTGDDRVENSGLLVGDLILGGGDNVFVNQASGVFVARSTLDLRDGAGSTGLFQNDGLLRMGLSASPVPIDLAAGETFANLDGSARTNLLDGARVITTVNLDGDLRQTASGRMLFDVAFGPYASDRINVTGDARVAGQADVTLTWLENAKPLTLIATGGAAYDEGLQVSDTLALDYSVAGGPDGLSLSYVSNFGQPFLNRNGRALGGHMDSALLEGDSGGIGRLMALLGNMRAGQETTYAAVFDQLDPQPYVAAQNLQFAGAADFSRNLFTCGQSFNERCAWAVLERTEWDRAATFDDFSVDSRSTRLRTGFQQPIGDGSVSVVGGVGYTSLDRLVVANGRALTTGDGVDVGLGLRTGHGGSEAAVALSGGWQWAETQRNVSVFTDGRGQAQNDSGYVQLSGRIAHTLWADGLFLRPAMNVSATGLYADAFRETGLAGLGVARDDTLQWVATWNPEVTAGVVMSDADGLHITASASAGLVLNSERRLANDFRLLGANPLSRPAVVTSGLDEEAARFGVGLDVRSDDDRLAVHLGVSTEQGDKVDANSVGFALNLRF